MNNRRPWVFTRGSDGLIDVLAVGSRPRGFTLVEVLAVLALVAIVATVTLAAFGGGSLTGRKLHAEARGIAAGLRMAQALAISSGQPQEVQVTPATHAWRGPHGRGRTLPAGMELVFTGAREAQPSAEVGAIRFFPQGGSTGGRVRVLQGDAGWDVDVAWLTGEVRLRRMGEAR